MTESSSCEHNGVCGTERILSGRRRSEKNGSISGNGLDQSNEITLIRRRFQTRRRNKSTTSGVSVQDAARLLGSRFPWIKRRHVALLDLVTVSFNAMEALPCRPLTVYTVLAAVSRSLNRLVRRKKSFAITRRTEFHSTSTSPYRNQGMDFVLLGFFFSLCLTIFN